MAAYPTTPKYLVYYKPMKDYMQMTDVSEFDGGAKDTNEFASDVPQIYELFYDGLTETEAKTLDDHHAANRFSTSFSFTEPRNEPWTGTTGSTVTVRYKTYERPKHEHYNIQSRHVVLEVAV